MAFLSIITRHMISRPQLFARCLESLRLQTCQDFEHVIITDDKGIGIAETYRLLRERDWSDLRGDYVYLLDDDNCLADSDVILRLVQFIEGNHCPDLIIVRANLLQNGILPDLWGEPPQMCHIDLGCVVLSKELFLKSSHYFGAHYAGDYDFIEAAYRLTKYPAWCDLLFMRAQVVSRGFPE